MIDTIPLGDILFLDIETVPQSPDFNTLSEEAQELWALKTKYQRKDEYTPEQFYERAGIWAEFGIIVCISVGYFLQTQDGRTFRVRSFTG
ncbi:MAG: 3'-5' exonuclease, partial [Robiginitalea sp.]